MASLKSLFLIAFILKLSSTENDIMENLILRHESQNSNFDFVYVGIFDDSKENNEEQSKAARKFKSSIMRHVEFLAKYEIMIGTVSFFGYENI